MKTVSHTQNRLMGKTIVMLSRILDFGSANQNVIAGNLANIDTPGFRPKELTFDQELKRATGKGSVRLKTTDPKHLTNDPFGGKGSFTIVTKEIGPMESDQVNIDAEMAKMMKNNLLYEVSTRLLSKKFQALRNIIGEGKR